MSELLFKGVLKTQKYDYIITINTSKKIYKDTEIIYSRYINIGSYISNENENKTCVDIHVMYPDSQKVLPFINYKLAKLITTHYNEKCSTDQKLERGDGTRHMINTAMYFVSKMCPFIEGFELNDASTRICDNDTTITLSYFSITNYGKTWYEKNFNAYIADKLKTDKYKETINNLINLNLTDWSTFEAMFLRGVDKEIKETLKEIYKDSDTYGDLFKNIHKLGISKACIYLQPWIDNLMLSTDLRNYVLFTQWIIPISSIKRIPFVNYRKDFVGKIEDYQDHKGGKKTRKRK